MRPPATPTKAFRDDPESEFWFWLAEKFGEWDVDELKRKMPNGLAVRWSVYFGRKRQREEIAEAHARALGGTA